MTEKRASSRRATYVPAKLFFDQEDASHDCLIVNVSDEGLAIEVEFLGLPPRAAAKEVTLKLVTGEVIVATRQWRSDRRIGLKLSGLAKLSASWTD